MLILWPLGLDQPGLRRGQPWVTGVVLGVVLVLGLAELLAPLLPSGLLPLALLGNSLRAEESFRLLSLWTNHLAQAGWWSLAISGLGWLTMAPVVERNLGSWRFLALILLAAPLAPMVQRLAGAAPAESGLAGLVAVIAGALLVSGLRTRMRWWSGIWLVVAVLVLRWRTPVVVVVAGWAGCELARRGWDCGVGLPWAGHALGLLAAALAGHVLTLVAGSDHRPPDLEDLAAGRQDLALLPELLAEEDSPPLPVLDRIAQRCLEAGDLEAARTLAAYLALRAPSGIGHRRLRAWLDGPPAQE